jgi:hypothetical protein
VIDRLDRATKEPGGRALLSKILQARAAYVIAYASALETLKQRKLEEARRIVTSEVLRAVDTMIAATEDLIRYHNRLLEHSGSVTAANYRADERACSS